MKKQSLNGHFPAELTRLRSLHHAARLESTIFRWKNAVRSQTSFANWRTSKNATLEGTMRRKDEAFSGGGRPILSGVREDGTDPEWEWIQQVDRACSAFLLKGGILYREEDL
jgi:hypothetical protein